MPAALPKPATSAFAWRSLCGCPLLVDGSNRRGCSTCGGLKTERASRRLQVLPSASQVSLGSTQLPWIVQAEVCVRSAGPQLQKLLSARRLLTRRPLTRPLNQRCGLFTLLALLAEDVPIRPFLCRVPNELRGGQAIQAARGHGLCPRGSSCHARSRRAPPPRGR